MRKQGGDKQNDKEPKKDGDTLDLNQPNIKVLERSQKQAIFESSS